MILGILEVCSPRMGFDDGARIPGLDCGGDLADNSLAGAEFPVGRADAGSLGSFDSVVAGKSVVA